MEGQQDFGNGGSRAFKQPRRGAARRGRGGMDGFPSLPGMAQGMPHFDPASTMEALMQMQAMGLPFPSFPNFADQGNFRGGRKQGRRRGRCRDFDTKGYCSRGSTCMFDHGNESVYMPPVGAKGEGMTARNYL